MQRLAIYLYAHFISGVPSCELGIHVINTKHIVSMRIVSNEIFEDVIFVLGMVFINAYIYVGVFRLFCEAI